MEPIYIDVHIHTSDNPDSLNTAYDLDTLLSKVDKGCKGCALSAILYGSQYY